MYEDENRDLGPAAEYAEATYVAELAAGPDPMAFMVRYKFVVIAILVVAALVSALPLRAVFTTPDTYAPTIATIDEKKTTVLGLTAAAAGASAAITAIPDDVGTPVADKLMDLCSNFTIVLVALYLEKYLLTIFGFTTFAVLIPVACALFAASLLFFRSRGGAVCAHIARKLLALGVVLMLAVPVSVFVTDMIDTTYETSAEITGEQVDEASGADAKEDDSNVLDYLLSIPGAVVDGLTSVSEELLNQVNRLIEWFAVMVVTSCVIPILVLVFFLWMANLILGINIDVPMNALKARGSRLKQMPAKAMKPSRKG